MSLAFEDLAPTDAPSRPEFEPALTDAQVLSGLDRILEEVITPLELCYLAKDDLGLFLTEFKVTLEDHDGISAFIETYPLSIIEYVPDRVTPYQAEGLEEYRRDVAMNHENTHELAVRQEALVQLACYIAFEIEAVLYDDPHEDGHSRVFNEDVDVDIDVDELQENQFDLCVANTA